MPRKKAFQPQGTVEIQPGYQPTANTIVYALFGKSLDSLVYDIRNNVDGKYDDLYVRPEKDSPSPANAD